MNIVKDVRSNQNVQNQKRAERYKGAESLNPTKKKSKKIFRLNKVKKYMIQRSIWSEGIFGQIKEDNHYDKLRRRGISGVKLEILLVCIGHNLRRYHTRKLEFQKNNKIN